MKQKIILRLISLFVVIIFLSGCASKESSKTGGASQQDASQLNGLWIGEKAFSLNFQTQKLEERKVTPGLDFAEFKDGQVCKVGGVFENAWGTGKYRVSCTAHKPYTVGGDKLIVEGSNDIVSWRIIDGKLELTFKRNQRDPMPYTKVIYKKINEAEIYKEGEPVNGKVPIISQPSTTENSAEQVIEHPQQEAEQPLKTTNPEIMRSEKTTLSLVKASDSGICLKHDGGGSISSYIYIKINDQDVSIISFGRFPSITDLIFDPGEAFVYALQSPATIKVGDRIQVIDEKGNSYPDLSDNGLSYWVVKNIVSEKEEGAQGSWGGLASCP